MKILILIIYVFPSIAFSQYDFGLKAGMNGVDLINKSTYENSTDYKPKLAFNGGIYLSFNFIDKLNILGELVYSNKGARYSDENNGSLGTLNLNYINLSYLASYQINKDFDMQAGLEFGYLINTVSKFENVTVSDYRSYDNFDFGLITGVKYHLFDNASLDLRYIIGLIRPFSDEVLFTNDEGVFRSETVYYRNHLIQLNFSYILLRGLKL